MARLYANNYSTTLNGSIDDTTTTITVTSVSGLPAIGSGDTCNLTIDDGTNIEVVQATAVSTNDLTVVRGQEGTSGTSFTDGTTIELRATRDAFQNCLENDQSPTLAGTLFADTYTIYWSGGGSGTSYSIGASGGTPFMRGSNDNYKIQTNNDGFTISYSSGNSMTFGDGTGITISSSLPFTIGAGCNIDFNGASSLKVPYGATPTISANGHLAVDSTVTDFSTGILKYYGGEEMGVIAMPIGEFTSPTDGHVVAYNATNDEFELVAPSGGGGVSFVGAQAALTSAQSISTGTVTVVNWDSENFDSGTLHDNSTNNSRITVPSAGKYQISANIVFSTNNTGIRQILIRKNGSGSLGSIIFDNNGAGEDQTFFFWNDDASSSDYYEIQVYQDSGSSVDVTTASVFTVMEIK